MTDDTTGIIILAAGSSTRMGHPKQTLPYHGTNLIRHIATTAISSQCYPVVVVLGAYADAVKPCVEDLPVTLVENPDWENGMGSSIKAGIGHPLIQDTGSVIIMLCDQPYITPAVLSQLVQTYRSTKSKIVASSYSGTNGVPALFSRCLYVELMSLAPNSGARTIIDKYRNEIVSLETPEGAIDIDTEEDYKRLLL